MSKEKKAEELKQEKQEKKTESNKDTIKEKVEELKVKGRNFIEEFRWTRKSIALAIAILVVIILIIAGISWLVQRSDNNIITEDNGVQYKISDEAYLGVSNIKSINPVTSTDRDTYYLSRLIYDGLFELDQNMVPQNNLVKNYTINKRDNKITIDLVNADFTDGKPLRASDVKFTIEALKASGKNNYSDLVSSIADVSTNGKNKVTIYFYEGSSMRLSDLTFPILPAHRYNGVYDIIYLSDIKPVGTGRYKASKFNNTTGMVLKANEKYHGEKAKNTITVCVMSKKSNVYKMTEAGNISLTESKDIGREAKITQKETKIVDFPANEVEYLGFNFTNEIMAKKNVRKAIATAINNERIIQECYYNSGMINDNIYYPNYMGVDSSKDAYKYSKTKAKRYLAKAGYKDRDEDGFVEDENMGEISLNLITTNTGTRQRAAEKIEGYLNNIGIHVSLSYMEEKSYQATLKSGSFDIFIGGFKYNESMNMDEILRGTEFTVQYQYDNNNSSSTGTSTSNGTTTDSEQSYTDEGDVNQGKYNDSTTDSNGGQSNMVEKKSYSKVVTNSNYTRYYSKKVNALLSDMNSGLNNDEMKAKFMKIKEKTIEDLPYYCLLYKTNGEIKAPTLQGDIKPVFWNIYNGAETWESKYEIEQSEDDQNVSDVQ